MIVAVPVTLDGQVDHRWGKADRVAVADVVDGEIASWKVHDTGWHHLHGQGHHGTHHGRIVRFLVDNDVETVVIHHAGASMINTMQKMGLKIVTNASGSARAAATAAAVGTQQK